jgi:hypothetical protein
MNYLESSLQLHLIQKHRRISLLADAVANLAVTVGWLEDENRALLSLTYSTGQLGDHHDE